MIYIRTDANDEIATGHMMRCLTVAEEIERQGENYYFIVSDQVSLKLLNKYTEKAICLNTSWKELDCDSEIKELRERITSKDKLIIDTPSAKKKYIEGMQKYVSVTYFDDLALDVYDIDRIINYNIFYPKFEYESRYKLGNTKLLLGGKYVPLRKQFTEVYEENNSKNIKRNIEDILIISGGGDKYNFIGNCLQILQTNYRKEFLKYNWHVVVGMYNLHTSEIIKFSEKEENIKVHFNVKNMAGLMKMCDLAISAASTVLYECCASQLPTLFFRSSYDQRYDVEYFSKNQMMLYCGDYENSEAKMAIFDKIVRYIGYVNNEEVRQKMINEMKKIIDVNGTYRIVENILRLS